MADAIVSIALERLANIIQNKIQEWIGLGTGVEEVVRYLSSELTAIRNVLDSAERRWYKEKSIRNWLNKLEDISYDIDDVLDEWNFAILEDQIEGSENFVGPKQKKRRSLIQDTFSYFKKATTRRDIAVKIKRLKERLDLIVKEKDRYGFTVGQVAGPRQSERVRSTSLIDVKEIHGRGADKDILVSKLILEGIGQESGSGVISIVGTGGIGKTTLAQLVYNDDRVIDFFKLQIWICVSDVFDEVRIAKGIVEIVEESSPNVHELEAILKSLRNCISGKRFLLVLDDVWTEDYTKWEPLKNSLKRGGPGSKILVTTRSERVARMMGTIENHRLGQLSHKDCWLLMQQTAFAGRREEKCVELQAIGENIANKCKGLPLAAKVLGSLLSFKDTVAEWENVLNSKVWQLEEAEVDLFPHLLLSYNELSPEMKRCFLYCSIFPKDSDIDVENLIRMWMAVGYLGSAGSSSDLELKGKQYFDNLRMRSFFQDFVENDDGMSCKMHDMVHDFAHFLMKRRNHHLENPVGRIEATEKGSCQALDPALVSQIKVYRSLFCQEELPSDLSDSVMCLRVLSLQCHGRLIEIPGYVENLIHLRYLDLSGNKLTMQVPQMISKLYNLQTLNVSHCGLKELPREIGNLIHLRHLDLSFNSDIKELPDTICYLHELRTLNLKHCRSLSKLPEEIYRLINLRHLPNYLTDGLYQIPQGLEQLTALQTLTQFYAGKRWTKLGYLKKLNQLGGSLELKINLHDAEDVLEANKAELRNKIHIKYLKIVFSNDMSRSDVEELVKNEVMEALQPPPNLQRLEISDFKGTKFPGWFTSSLNNMKVLKISFWDYCSTLPPLGKLPCLEELSVVGMKELKFLNREFLGIERDIGSSMPSSVIGFPKLKQLRFLVCPSWEEWEDITAEEAGNAALSIMPCLKEVHIYNNNLMELPHRLLRKASTLVDLIVGHSPHLFKLYEDKNGSGWRSLSHIPNVVVTTVGSRHSVRDHYPTSIVLCDSFVS